MTNIILGNKSVLKNMIKTLRERTAIITQDDAGNNVVTIVTVVVSARSEQCFYALLLWIKIIPDQERSITPRGFTTAVLTE